MLGVTLRRTTPVLCGLMMSASLIGCRSREAGEPVASSPAPEQRPVTLTGCVTRTSDQDVFILSVPGEVLRTVRGIGKGRPVPPGSEAGTAPVQPPGSLPPEDPKRPPFEPQGRYSTPTVRNVTYRLESDGGADLGSMVGKTVEVTGMLPTEGYPSGDKPEVGDEASGATAAPRPLTVRSVRFVSDGCPDRR